MASKVVDVDALSTAERLDLLEQLWDSLSGNPTAIPLTEAQREELDRRDAELEKDIRLGRPLGIPWDQVLKEIRDRT
jgi:putative addiction module component (TIGR02574 family)